MDKDEKKKNNNFDRNFVLGINEYKDIFNIKSVDDSKAYCLLHSIKFVTFCHPLIFDYLILLLHLSHLLYDNIL